jgi:hypothetical protein
MESGNQLSTHARSHRRGGGLWPGVSIFRFILKVFRLLLIDLHLWPKAVEIADLTFPVLLLRPYKSQPYFEFGPETLTTIDKNTFSPTEGAIIIDSDFRQYVQKNVRCKQGDISMIFRALVPGDRPFTYSFTLKRRRTAGLAAALAQLNECTGFYGETDGQQRKRQEIARQTTVPGIIEVISSDAVRKTPALGIRKD